MIDKDTIENWFTYHPPNEVERVAYESIRNAAKEMAFLLVQCTPACADQTAALRKLRECVMTANAAIACNGLGHAVNEAIRKVAEDSQVVCDTRPPPTPILSSGVSRKND